MISKSMTMGMTALLLFTAGIAVGEGPSAEKGEQLFNDPALGGSTNSASCGSCHQGGKGLIGAGGDPGLENMINTCIEKALKGDRLEKGSGELESLELYIRSLSEK